MRTLIIAAFSLMSVCSFAQSTSIENRIEMRLEKLNDMVMRDRAHRYATEEQKRELLKNINLSIMSLSNSSPNPNPTPNPYPPAPNYQPAECRWFDGSSLGIAQRGWHAYRQINNVTFSLAYHGNSSTVSQAACLKDIIFNHDQNDYRYSVNSGAATTCSCSWFDGSSFAIAERGWHMTYKVPLLKGGEAVLSSGYFNNSSTASEQECKRQLVRNNFVCPVR